MYKNWMNSLFPLRPAPSALWNTQDYQAVAFILDSHEAYLFLYDFLYIVCHTLFSDTFPDALHLWYFDWLHNRQVQAVFYALSMVSSPPYVLQAVFSNPKYNPYKNFHLSYFSGHKHNTYYFTGFEGIDIAALRICDIRPYFSESGNSPVSP